MPKDSKKIILIGGAPTVGKSTLAKSLSDKLNIPWVSTDQIRQIMRSATSRVQTPSLFNPEGYDAEKFLNEFSADQIVEMEIAQGEATWVGVKAFIEDAYPWIDSYIIEGIAILPHFVHKDMHNLKEVCPVFLVDSDADRVREVVFNRGLWDDARLYPDELKEKEVEWVLKFNDHIVHATEKYHYPKIEVSKKFDDLTMLMENLGIKK